MIERNNYGNLCYGDLCNSQHMIVSTRTGQFAVGLSEVLCYIMRIVDLTNSIFRTRVAILDLKCLVGWLFVKEAYVQSL